MGTIRPDLGPMAVRVSSSVCLSPGGAAQDIGAALYLLWPGEVAEATAPGAPDPALERHVEERGFTVINRGRLALETRDRTKLGTLAQGTSPPGGGVLRHLLQDGHQRRAIRDRHVRQDSLDAPSSPIRSR